MSGLTRRAWGAAAAAWLGACRERPYAGTHGAAITVNQGGPSLSIVNLQNFSLARQIPLDAAPSGVVAGSEGQHPAAVFAEAGRVVEVLMEKQALGRSALLGGSAHGWRRGASGGETWFLCDGPPALALFSHVPFRVTRRIRLSGKPFDLDIARDGRRAAVSLPEEKAVEIVSLQTGQPEGRIALEDAAGIVRFRSDGKLVLCCGKGTPGITLADPAQRRIAAILPLAFAPENYCVTPDGGQVFLSGSGTDSVAIVFPYSLEVGETILAGSRPGALAISRSGQLLFVANPRSNGVTIIEIETRRLVGAVAVGAGPSQIQMTPDDRFALVLNRESGDLAAIRTGAIIAQRRKMVPLFTIVPVGASPVDLAVVSL